MSYRLNLELLVTKPVLLAVKEYDINIPELCINAIMSEIEKHNSIETTVTSTTASREFEIRELKEALRKMREKLDRTETPVETPKFKLWHKQ
jgi:hypothetical protein